MASVVSPRLRDLSLRYASAGAEPAGEAFYRAFGRYIKANRKSLLDITLAVTSAHISLPDGPDGVDPLLLKAIHTTNPSLTTAHLFSLGGDELQGAVNAAKGKYFEYLVVDRLNNGEQVGPTVLPDGSHAELAESLTQPGWDLRIVDSHGMTAEYLQLKATDSLGYIKEALERYPDIEILATLEVAHSGVVLDSGVSDAQLHEQVSAAIDVVDSSLTEDFLDYFNPLLPLVAIAAWEGYKVSVGQQSLDAFKLEIARRGQRVVAANLAGAAVYAVGGGYLAIPAAYAGGLLFDRTINQTAILTSYKDHKNRMLALRLSQQDRELSGRLK